MPFGAKDIIDTFDEPTEYGSLGVQLIAGWHRDSQLLSQSTWVFQALTTTAREAV